MSYTFTTALGDGTTTVFPFSFAGQDTGYLSTSNVQVFVGGVSVPFTINLTDPNKVQLSSPPAVGAEVLIRRIMPKNVPYSDFARGNPFSQDTLNNTNLQQLYVVQELLDGFLPVGFYLKQDVNMGGHILVNLGQGTKSGDSVNWDQWEDHEERIDALENDLTGITSKTIPYYYIATGGETRWQVSGRTFDSAIMFINGVFQNQNLGAFSISSNGFNFPEPLQTGDEVYALIGSTPATGSMTDDQDVEVIQPISGAIKTTQHEFNSRFLSPLDAGAKGNSTDNDSLAFTNFELQVQNRDVDLHGKSYVVTAIPAGNRYFNGKFTVAGVIHNANYIFVRNINNVVNLIGESGAGIPEDYTLPARNVFTYRNGSFAAGGALSNAVKAGQTVAIGPDAMGNTLISFENIALGEVALQNVQSESDQYSSTRLGTRNVAAGGNALQFLTNGAANVAIGRNAGTCAVNVQECVFLGQGAGFGAAVRGWYDSIENFIPNTIPQPRLTIVGANAGNRFNGQYLTALGTNAGLALKNGTNNTVLGVNSGASMEDNVGFGGYALTSYDSSLALSYNKVGSLITVTHPGHSCVVGGKVSTRWLTGPAKGSRAGNNEFPSTVVSVTADSYTVSCPLNGDGAGTCNPFWSITTTLGALSTNNLLAGSFSMGSSTRGIAMTVLGSLALEQGTGEFNSSVFIGNNAGRKIPSAVTTVAVGNNTLQNNTAPTTLVTALGHNAGVVLQDGTTPSTLMLNTTLLGANSKASGNNQVQLGDSVTTPYAFAALQLRSDSRDKEEVRDTNLGIEFINGLRPVLGKWNMRDDYLEPYEVQVGIDGNAEPIFETRYKFDEEAYLAKTKMRTREHNWFIAQEVEALCQGLGVDFAGLHHAAHNGGSDVYSLGYEEFIPPITKAIQQCWSRMDELEARIKELES